MKQEIEKILKYKQKIPGVQSALDLIENLNYLVKNIQKGEDTKYYNYCNNEKNIYDFVDFNVKLQELHATEVVFRKTVIYNNLYIKMSNLYDGRYSKFNYEYRNNLFNSHNLLSILLRNFRKNYDGTFIFSLQDIFQILKYQIFSHEISVEKQCAFLLAYIYDLEDNKIIKYDYVNNFIEFVTDYREDLLKLMYCSFDCVNLGRKKQQYRVVETKILLDFFDVEKMANEYENYSQIKKFIVSDLLYNIILMKCTDFVSFSRDANNLLLDCLEEKLLIK